MNILASLVLFLLILSILTTVLRNVAAMEEGEDAFQKRESLPPFLLSPFPHVMSGTGITPGHEEAFLMAMVSVAMMKTGVPQEQCYECKDGSCSHWAKPAFLMYWKPVLPAL